MKTKIFPLLYFLLIVISSVAQDYRLHVDRIGIEDGLSSYHVQDIAQDAKGYIWLATDYGLNRYDGQQIVRYTKEENGLCGNNVKEICFDKKGFLWIKILDYNNNFCYSILDTDTEQLYSLEQYLNTDFPFDLQKAQLSYAADFESILFYVNTAGKASFYEYNGNSIAPIFPQFDASKYAAYNYIGIGAQLATDRYFLWFQPKDKSDKATPNDIVLLLNRAGELQQLQTIPPGHTGIINHQISHYKEPFYTYCDKDFVRFIQQKLVVVPFNQPSDSIVLNNIRLDLPNALLQSDSSLYLIDLNHISQFDKAGKLLKKARLPFELNLNHHALLLDKNDNFWLSNDKYLYCLSFKKQYFVREMTDNTPPIKCRSIFKASDDNLYLAALGALYSNKGGTWVSKRNTTSPLIQNLWHNSTSIHQEGDSLLVGIEGGYLLVYNLQNWQFGRYDFVEAKPGLTPKMVWDVFRSPSGRLWIGSMYGLFYLDTTVHQFVPFDVEQKLPVSSAEIWYFHHNKAGTWLCTSKGLMLMDLESGRLLQHYSILQKQDNYIPALKVCHLHEDTSGVFWLATKGDGLVRFDPRSGAYRQYTQNGAGLSNNVLYAVYGDNYGHLWLPSDRGLMRFNKASELIQLYTEEDGLPHTEFNTIAHHQDAAGRLYFGGQNGFIHFHPDDIETAKSEAAFKVSSCYKMAYNSDSLINISADLAATSSIYLQPNDKSLRLDLALLDYNDSKNQQYAYQIKGYEDKWHYLKGGLLLIKNLPYGQYQLNLRAKAANSGSWINYPQPIDLYVQAPFYLQNWFIILAIIFILIGIVVAVRWRLKSLIERKDALEALVRERTAKIEKDKAVIEAQAEELKSLDQLKSRFFANISHELRTPLTLILGPLSYLLDEKDAWDRQEVQQQLQTMYRNGKSLMHLIEEILDLSKLEANKLELQEESTPLRLFVEQIVDKFRMRAQTLQIELQLEYGFAEEMYLLLDRNKMEKVINNFLSNAFKFSPSGAVVLFKLLPFDNQLQLQVEDKGKGIHSSDLPHVFDRFYQAKFDAKKREGGTGIGLALVKEFANLMHGNTYATSDYGQGSTFYFEIPLKLAAPVDIQEKTTSTELQQEYTAVLQEDIYSISSDFTILVVEDNLDMQDFIVKLLTPKFSNVIRANNGIEGLEILSTGSDEIHLIVSDIMMPKLDGITMVELIKADPTWRTIPIVMLTALSEERDKLKALTIGVDDYINKPFSSAELIVRIQNLLFNYVQRNAIAEELLPVESEAVSDNQVNEQAEKETNTKDKAWIDTLQDMVMQSMQDKIVTVEQLSEQSFISKRQLGRRLKKITGLTPAKFIKAIQLEEARRQLQSGTSLNVTEVAFNCGFDSPSSFSTIFKKYYGKSPKSYFQS